MKINKVYNTKKKEIYQKDMPNNVAIKFWFAFHTNTDFQLMGLEMLILSLV